MRNTIATIGNFDGLHTGHLKLIAKVINLAKKHNMSSLVCSFDTNTKEYSELIFPQKQLKAYLSELNVNHCKQLKFLKDIKGLSCEEFVKKYIVNEYNAKYVVVGEDFFFGKEKSGNTETLCELGKKYGFKTIVLKLLKSGEVAVSSTYIRELLKDGSIEKANSLMYNPFSIFGVVKKGNNIGSTALSCPTANISIPKNTVPLKHGVYKTKIVIDGKEYNSITNIGHAPIKRKINPTIETHIFDYDKDIYKKRIKIVFLKYIREERQFKNIEALKKQIARDIIKAKG